MKKVLFLMCAFAFIAGNVFAEDSFNTSRLLPECENGIWYCAAEVKDGFEKHVHRYWGCDREIAQHVAYTDCTMNHSDCVVECRQKN
jgi:hypothetical protein